MRKVAELEGAELDYWVAKAAGYLLDEDGDRVDHEGRDSGGAPGRWRPSTDWSDGGPIIDREHIVTVPTTQTCAAFVLGHYEATGAGQTTYIVRFELVGRPFTGPTPLVAAMRAYVASKFGHEVPPIASQPG